MSQHNFESSPLRSISLENQAFRAWGNAKPSLRRLWDRYTVLVSSWKPINEVEHILVGKSAEQFFGKENLSGLREHFAALNRFFDDRWPEIEAHVASSISNPKGKSSIEIHDSCCLALADYASDLNKAYEHLVDFTQMLHVAKFFENSRHLANAVERQHLFRSVEFLAPIPLLGVRRGAE